MIEVEQFILDLTYSAPTGGELPGEHWNARLIRKRQELSRLLRHAERFIQVTNETHVWNHVDWKERAEKAEAAIERVRELHAVDPESYPCDDDGCCGWCKSCGLGFPCPTIQALDDGDQEDDEPDLDRRESTVDEVLNADERDGIKR